MPTILLPGASLGPGKNFLPAVESAKRTDACPLPKPPAQFDAETPLSSMTISDIEEKLRALCHNANPRLLLGLAELDVQQLQSWIRLAHFLILRANELHQEPGRLRRLLEWPLNQARARPVVASAVTVVVLAVVVVLFIPVPDDYCGGQYKPNITRLDGTIQRKLHGQPLVQDIVVRYLKDHVNTPSPKRALVMSFHGPPGVGKNYVGGMVAGSLFLDGLNSPCVCLRSAKKHFPHHDSHSIKGYKDTLHRLIPEAIRSCPRTLFIFDEANDMPEGLIDTIKPYVDGDPVDGQNFNKAVFLFLSNTGATTITAKFVALRKGGTERINFKIRQFENIIRLSAQTGDACSNQLGMESGVIPDDRITASSYWGPNHESFRGRLKGVAGVGAWAAKTNTIGEWLQVDLGEMKRVTGMSTQGRQRDAKQWVTTYKLQYSTDLTSWATYADSVGSEKVFQGNTDMNTPVTNLLDNPFDARYVRFVAQSWVGHISMRAEVLGCVLRTDKKTGMWHASLLEHSLVHVVPFLPLELKEVESCIRDVMLEMGREADISTDMWAKIADEISFIEKDGVKYSENGCRDVRSKALLHLGK